MKIIVCGFCVLLFFFSQRLNAFVVDLIGNNNNNSFLASKWVTVGKRVLQLLYQKNNLACYSRFFFFKYLKVFLKKNTLQFQL